LSHKVSVISFHFTKFAIAYANVTRNNLNYTVSKNIEISNVTFRLFVFQNRANGSTMVMFGITRQNTV